MAWYDTALFLMGLCRLEVTLCSRCPSGTWPPSLTSPASPGAGSSVAHRQRLEAAVQNGGTARSGGGMSPLPTSPWRHVLHVASLPAKEHGKYLAVPRCKGKELGRRQSQRALVSLQPPASLCKGNVPVGWWPSAVCQASGVLGSPS